MFANGLAIKFTLMHTRHLRTPIFNDDNEKCINIIAVAIICFVTRFALVLSREINGSLSLPVHY